MDDTEDDARYTPNPNGVDHQQGYGSLNRQKLDVRSGLYSQEVDNHYAEDDIDDEDEEGEEQLEEEEDDDGEPSNLVQLMDKDVDDDETDDDDDDDEDDDTKQKSYTKRAEDVDSDRHPKKRKLKSLVSSYEFARRIPAPSAVAPSSAAPSASKPSFGGRNALTDWSEHETFVLLDAWGDRFLQHGRKSLRSEEWQEVAEKVSEVSKIERTDTQCRNRLDTLKKKYKKEKIKLAGMGDGTSKWVYFEKMDKLMSSPPVAPQSGLSCGLDSGEYVFMKPTVYLTRANELDEMRDSPGNSQSTGQEDGSDGLPPKKRRHGRENDEGSSFSLLANSIQKFSEIYEKIERNKRQQMVELEKMRMDFHRDLEMQKRQILERAQLEIAKLRQAEDEENDDSAENASG